MKTQRIEDWLREAYGPDRGCPPPEAYLKDSLDGMSDAERERIRDHASRCPACAAEQELARGFDATPEEAEACRGDIDFVVSRLRSPVADVATVVPLEKARSRMAWWQASRTWYAAAAVLVVAVFGAVLTLRSPAPMLPSRGEDAVVRGGRMVVGEPVGELTAMPRTLRWEAVEGAANYRIRLMKVDETALFEYMIADLSVDLPRDVREQMHPAVVYFWQVEAIDPEGNRIAWSDRVQFRVRPGAGGRRIGESTD